MKIDSTVWTKMQFFPVEFEIFFLFVRGFTLNERMRVSFRIRLHFPRCFVVVILFYFVLFCVFILVYIVHSFLLFCLYCAVCLRLYPAPSLSAYVLLHFALWTMSFGATDNTHTHAHTQHHYHCLRCMPPRGNWTGLEYISERSSKQSKKIERRMSWLLYLYCKYLVCMNCVCTEFKRTERPRQSCTRKRSCKQRAGRWWRLKRMKGNGYSMKIMLILNRKSFEYDKFSILLGNDKEKWFVRPHSCVCRTISSSCKKVEWDRKQRMGQLKRAQRIFSLSTPSLFRTLTSPSRGIDVCLGALRAHINPFPMDEWHVICIIIRAFFVHKFMLSLVFLLCILFIYTHVL